MPVAAGSRVDVPFGPRRNDVVAGAAIVVERDRESTTGTVDAAAARDNRTLSDSSKVRQKRSEECHRLPVDKSVADAG
jgi:hypothetical protein